MSSIPTSPSSGRALIDQRKEKLHIVKDNETWNRTLFVARLGRQFTSYEQMMEYFLADMDDPNSTIDFQRRSKKAYQSLEQITDVLTEDKFQRLWCRDTSIYGNDAINCYPAFNEDDDIIHLMGATKIRETPNGDEVIESGMGRVYAETYENFQKILWISAGVAKYAGIFTFFSSAVNSDLAALTHGTYHRSLAGRVAGALTYVALMPIDLMLMPIRYLYRFAHMLKKDNISKYYDFWADMTLYYEYVNLIVQHVSVNLGLFPGADSAASASGQGSTSVSNAPILIDSSETEASDGNSMPGIPEYLNNGVDVFAIRSKRETFATTTRSRNGIKPERRNSVITDDFIRQHTNRSYFKKLLGIGFEDIASSLSDLFNPVTSFITDAATTAWNSATAGDKYIGFRVEKSTDASESFSNSTGESSIAQMINNAASTARNVMFSAGGSGEKSGLLDNVLSAPGEIINSVANTVGSVLGGGLGDFASTMIKGNAYIDIPEVWTGSQFSKSYNFRTTLRDFHGGNPVSFVQNIIVPLACLIALAMPRSAGKSSYGSPFLIRAYCKGMFAIPLGIVENMSITRGAAEHGWSIYGLPTVVEVNFSIKDLATVMHMALDDVGIFGMPTIESTLAENSPFQEYLLTLSSVGVRERSLFFSKVNRNKALWMRMFNSTVRNSSHLGMMLGNTFPFALYGAISSYDGQPSVK